MKYEIWPKQKSKTLRTQFVAKTQKSNEIHKLTNFLGHVNVIINQSWTIQLRKEIGEVLPFIKVVKDKRLLILYDESFLKKHIFVEKFLLLKGCLVLQRVRQRSLVLRHWDFSGVLDLQVCLRVVGGKEYVLEMERWDDLEIKIMKFLPVFWF